MGSVQSSQERSADPGNGDEDNDEDDDARLGVGSGNPAPADSGRLLKKLLQQEPEILPCHAPATPLSAVGTPRLSPSIKVWDPCHVLSPVPPPHPFSIRPPLPSSFEIVLVAHGECGANLRPDLIGGRWPAATLTAVGCRQARALAVFLKSQGMVFNAVYSSPLSRARATAASVYQIPFESRSFTGLRRGRGRATLLIGGRRRDSRAACSVAAGEAVCGRKRCCQRRAAAVCSRKRRCRRRATAVCSRKRHCRRRATEGGRRQESAAEGEGGGGSSPEEGEGGRR